MDNRYKHTGSAPNGLPEPSQRLYGDAVRSDTPAQDLDLGLVNKTEAWRSVPCKLWAGIMHTDGYGLVLRKVDGKWVKFLAHRVAWVRNRGLIPEGLNVCHHCDNRACTEIAHLFLGTHADNVADKVAKGRQHRGADFPQARLNDERVLDIRLRYANGDSQQALADEHGVSRQLVSRVVRGDIWKHVGGPITGATRQGGDHRRVQPSAQLS